jgi:exodeoxyribonuclease V gamma subunit
VRSEDRQLLLDAIAATTETLVITYTGRGEHNGAERPAAVPLGELLDALDRTAAEPVRAHVLTHHPLQPFDEANLVPGRLRGTRPFTFDRSALAGARAARGERTVVRELVPAALPAVHPPVSEVSLADLQDFFRHPVQGFLRRRLRITKPFEVNEVKDAIPITLDGLEQWGVGDLLATAVLGGAHAPTVLDALRVGGRLPPGALGEGVLEEIKRKAGPLVLAARSLQTGPSRTLDVDVDLGDRRLTGTVADVFGNNLVSVSFSNLGAKHRLAAWLDALALAAGHPDENWTAHTIGKHRSGGQVAMVRPLAAHDARAWLRDLVDLYEAGLCEPLPLPVRTSLVWAEEFRRTRAGSDGDPDTRARPEWETPRFNDSGFPKEDADVWHVRAFGEHAPYDLLASPLRHGEAGPAPHRLGHYAWRLWAPLLGDPDGETAPQGNEQIRSI